MKNALPSKILPNLYIIYCLQQCNYWNISVTSIPLFISVFDRARLKNICRYCNILTNKKSLELYNVYTKHNTLMITIKVTD